MRKTRPPVTRADEMMARLYQASASREYEQVRDCLWMLETYPEDDTEGNWAAWAIDHQRSAASNSSMARRYLRLEE